MEAQRTQVESWVRQVFGVCGIDPPQHLVVHYVDSMMKGTLSHDQIQQEVLLLSGHGPRAPATRSAAAAVAPRSAPAAEACAPALSPSSSGSSLSGPNVSESAVTDELGRIQDELGAPTAEHKKLVREYAEQLFITYTGKKGDPASFNYVLQGLIDKQLSYTQAELFVKFSKVFVDSPAG
eukprot:TRINITY_DN3289_c0_g1_i1.p1 TRINITY_DN3289_c0_g1~~TRINITY_DN3289_c0_g1_i1.p1  ORF type:complete len:180 (+),score=23.76 TRINITY_DN3289_c0_g1_i1:101-640(+)